MADIVRPRRARAGVFGTFFLLGFSLATWATNLPAIPQRTAIGTAAIGIGILAVGVATLAGAQLCGPPVGRIGDRIAAPGAPAFLLMLSEGTAGSRGALHAVHQLHVTDAEASLA